MSYTLPDMTISVDGRTTRWARHNATRRRELVEAALRAIRHHGHSVGMDDIAAEAGTSKTVYYRHFGDRNGLYEAVVESVHAFIWGNLSDPRRAGMTVLPLGTVSAPTPRSVLAGNLTQ